MYMIFLNEGSVCPSSGYLITEQEKKLVKLALTSLKANVNVHSLTKTESVCNEQ